MGLDEMRGVLLVDRAGEAALEQLICRRVNSNSGKYNLTSQKKTPRRPRRSPGAARANTIRRRPRDPPTSPPPLVVVG